MRFARLAEDAGLADEVRGHLEARAFWIEPAAYCTGLVSEILDVLRHPAALQRDVGRRPGRMRHYVGIGRTPEGHLLRIGFHFERTGEAAAGSMAHAGFGSRLLVDSAWCEAEPARRPGPSALSQVAGGFRPWWAT
jgi:hypothetical protein